MATGVSSTDTPIVAFVDADLQGLTGDHVDAIIEPVLARRCEMCVGIFRGGRVWSDMGHRISPFLSGQRALRRELFEAVPYVAELRLGIEVALNKAAKHRRDRVERVVLPGVSNVHKEQKLGLVRGVSARMRMYGEIAEASFRTRPRTAPAPRKPWL
jgi:hypothetical protein